MLGVCDVILPSVVRFVVVAGGVPVVPLEVTC